MSLRAGGFLVATSLFLSTLGLAQTSTLNFNNIDDQSGWQSCSICAGGQNSSNNYTGPVKSRNPSLDGASAQFSLRYPWPQYANVLWWKQELMGGADHNTIASLYNFTYDLYYYIKKPSASQALEFDVNQTICDGNCTSGTSTRYIFGTECNNANTGTWRVWSNSSAGWINTYIPCSMPAFQWNHLVFQFQRTSTNQVNFISLTFNGKTYYINKQFAPTPLSVQADDFNAAFQMDGDFHGNPYTTWIDEMKLTAW